MHPSDPDRPLAALVHGAGPPTLLVHGFPLDHTMWRETWAGLADTATCIAPDLRGFGQSRLPFDDRLTMEQHADDLARLLDHLGVARAHVVGLSMGGYAALAFADRHPARLRSLALVDSRAEGEDEAGRARRDAAVERLLEVGRGAFGRELCAKLVAPGAAATVRARLLTTIEATPYETIAAALRGMRDRPDRTGVLRGLAVPFLAVCGELDALTPPPFSEAMAAAAPRGRCVLVPGAGHMAPMERPREVVAALRAHFAGA